MTCTERIIYLTILPFGLGENTLEIVHHVQFVVCCRQMLSERSESWIEEGFTDPLTMILKSLLKTIYALNRRLDLLKVKSLRDNL